MIIAGIVIVSLTAYIFYFLMPNLSNTATAGLKLIEAQSKVSQLNYMAEQAKQLEEEIKALDSQLETSTSSLPTGVNDARILLYLKELTDGHADGLQINISAQPQTQGNFLLQSVVLDFHASYDDYIQILTDLKENKLYSRATYVQASYEPVATATPEAAATATPDATASPEASASPSPGASAAASASAAAPTATPTASATESPEPTTIIDDKVLNVHIELNFYCLVPENGVTAAEPLEPITGTRSGSLFPIN